MNELGKPAAWKAIAVRAAAISVLAELITLAARFGIGITATEFNRTAPLLLQIHHMFWSVPLLAVASFTRPWPRIAAWFCALAVACVVSDLAHHFVALPLLVGEAGWHWP